MLSSFVLLLILSFRKTRTIKCRNEIIKMPSVAILGPSGRCTRILRVNLCGKDCPIKQMTNYDKNALSFRQWTTGQNKPQLKSGYKLKFLLLLSICSFPRPRFRRLLSKASQNEKQLASDLRKYTKRENVEKISCPTVHHFCDKSGTAARLTVIVRANH